MKPRPSAQPNQPDPSAAAFVMEDGDRFHSIIVSDSIFFGAVKGVEMVLTFFAIRRASGNYEIVNVNKTFKGGKCISRNIQTKKNIFPQNLQSELTNVHKGFGDSIEEQTGFRITWHILNLSAVEDGDEQIKQIQDWGRVGVKVGLDLPPFGQN